MGRQPEHRRHPSGEIVASDASHNRAAVLATASSTGRISVGELLMTLQDVGGRGLLLERFGELAVARPQLVEEPHVLDRDHRLIGEGSE